jgi:hypothetical protein
MAVGCVEEGYGERSIVQSKVVCGEHVSCVHDDNPTNTEKKGTRERE